jgi:NOL1/NOP2/sun family putative RNA methylase
VLPERFKQRMAKLLKDQSAAFFQALEQPPITGIRVNTNKISPQDFQILLGLTLEPVPWCSSGFVIEDNKLSGKHPFHAAGLFYFQEPSAMAVAEALQPKAGELVLDLAAAPGGKSTHLVSLTGNKSVVIANEVNRSRVKALSENLERWGSLRAIITNESVENFMSLHHSVDKVLLDAPCSGEGMFRKSSEALEMWSEEIVLGCAKRQHGLIHHASKLVKAGGSLVYSTCTFAPEENEEVIAKFLETHPDFELAELPLEVSPAGLDWIQTQVDVSSAKRLWPHKHKGEGHFIAKLKKTQGEFRQPKAAHFYPVSPQVKKLWKEFCQQSFRQKILDMPLTLFGDKLYAVDETIPHLQGIHMVKTGIWLGTVLRNRFEPSHSLALTLDHKQLKHDMAIDFELKDQTLMRYLQGHPLESTGEKGWVLITVQGFPIGWGKRSGNVVNNAYPKGLRLH